MKTITPTELKKTLDETKGDVVLLDVRESYEHAHARIPDAKNIPLKEVKEAVDSLKKVGTVYVHCGSGGRSAQACQLLSEEGVNVVNVEGGINAWRGEGFEVLGGSKSTLSLERQVFIVAGTLILIGIALGFLVHEWWYGLSAFVGAGLVFSGTTGTCSMAYVLKYMPWNKG